MAWTTPDGGEPHKRLEKCTIDAAFFIFTGKDTSCTSQGVVGESAAAVSSISPKSRKAVYSSLLPIMYTCRSREKYSHWVSLHGDLHPRHWLNRHFNVVLVQGALCFFAQDIHLKLGNSECLGRWTCLF